MRVIILAMALLASSSLSPSFAQETGAPPMAAPQTVPMQPDQDSRQQRGQRAERDRSRDDDREMDGDWRMRRGDSDRMGREDREMGPGRRMHRDRDEYRDSDKDHGRYGDRAEGDNRGPDRADRGRSYGDAYDENKPRRRVKICVEYENGDEYCRYRQGR